MNRPLTYFISGIASLLFLLSLTAFGVSPGKSATASPPDCPCACDPKRDSMALVNLYESTDGENWANKWNLETLMGTWHGVNLDKERCVVELNLQNNQLNGSLPNSIGDLCRLHTLEIYDNGNTGNNTNGRALRGPIPESFGNLCNLQDVRMGNCLLSGLLPTKLSEWTKLKIFLIGNNKLSGPFPDLSFSPLFTLILEKNEFSSFPNHSNIKTWQTNNYDGCRVRDNFLTFDDIIPNMKIREGDVCWEYAPQKPIPLPYKKFFVREGETLSVSLGFDEGVPNSTYRWLRVGETNAFDTLYTNEIVFNQVKQTDRGFYRCEITNSQVMDPQLILKTEPFELIVCPLIEESRKDSICAGQSYQVGEKTYTMPGQYRDTLKTGEGCDSIVHLTLLVQGEAEFGAADAGADIYTCDLTIDLTGNLLTGPENPSGRWTALPDGTTLTTLPRLSNPPLEPGENFLVWSLKNNTCPDYYSSDTVVVTYFPPVQAQNDTMYFQNGEEKIDIQVTDNDDDLSQVEEWVVYIKESPTSGQLRDLGVGHFSYIPPPLLSDTVRFIYELCQIPCDDNCATAQVTLIPDGLEVYQQLAGIPNLITPNGDGRNDVFVVPQIRDNLLYQEDNELIVYDGNNGIVYQAKPYRNNWMGTFKNGSFLPIGNYFYKLRLGRQTKVHGTLAILRP